MFTKGGKKDKKGDDNADFDTIDDKAKQSSSKQAAKPGMASGSKAIDDKAKRSSSKQAATPGMAVRADKFFPSNFKAKDVKAKQSSSKHAKKQGKGANTDKLFASRLKAIDDKAKQSTSKPAEKQGIVAKFGKLLAGSSKASASDNEMVLKMPVLIPEKVVKRINEEFTDGKYPIGRTYIYMPNAYDQTAANRITSEDNDLDNAQLYNDFRRAGASSLQTRKFIRGEIKTDMKIIDIHNKIDKHIRFMINENGLKSGLATPISVSLNSNIKYFTPGTYDHNILEVPDLLKISYGVHVNGRIVDSAFTMSFVKKRYSKLQEAVRDAMEAGVAAAGIDVPFSEVGDAIKEVLISREVSLGGKIFKIKPIRELPVVYAMGQYRLYDGTQTRMKENHAYAIDVFGSTGFGSIVRTGEECTHYMKNFRAKKTLNYFGSELLLRSINRNFGTLMFSRRWLKNLWKENYDAAFNGLVEDKVLTGYPPIWDIRGSSVANMKHTILMRPSCKEVLSEDPRELLSPD